MGSEPDPGAAGAGPRTRATVLFNPTAGDGVTRARLEPLVRPHLPEAEIRSAPSPGELAELVARAADTSDLLVIAGGDGLVHQVVNRLGSARARLTLALIPLGTGNDLARSLGVPRRPDEALSGLVAGLSDDRRVRPIDLIRFSGADLAPAVLVNLGLFGFGADIRLGRRAKRWCGRHAYLLAAVSRLSSLSSGRVRLGIDGEEHELDAYLLAVANGSYMGGGVEIARGAEPDDGMIDIVAVPRVARRRLPGLALRILRGDPRADAELFRRRGRTLAVEAPTGWTLNADGERLAGRASRFEIVPAGVRFLIPVHRPASPGDGGGAAGSQGRRALAGPRPSAPRVG